MCRILFETNGMRNATIPHSVKRFKVNVSCVGAQENAAGSAPKLVRSIGAERAALFRIETRSRNVGVIAPEGRAAVARVPIDPRSIGVRLDPDVVSVQAVPAVRIRRPLARSEIDARLTGLKLCWNDRADREKKGKRRRRKCSSLLSGNTHTKTSLPH